MIKNIFSFCKNYRHYQIPKTMLQYNQFSQFASKQKKDKAVQLKRHVETLEDQLIKSKKDDTKAKENLIIEKNKKNVNKMPQDVSQKKSNPGQINIQGIQKKINDTILTQENNQFQKITEDNSKLKEDKKIEQDSTFVNESQLNMILIDKEKYISFDNLDFPWDFQGINKVQKEQNLKTTLDVSQLLDEKTAINIYKTFLTSLEEFDYEQLNEIMEKKFFRRLCKRLQAMQQENVKIKYDNIKTKQITVDLYKIQNIFGVGVEQNRFENDGSINYVIFDEFLNKDVPAKHIIKRRVEPNELARILVQLHLNIESDISLKLANEKNNTEKSDAITNKEQKKQYHTMILEKVIVECDYKSMRNKSFSIENTNEYIQQHSNEYIKDSKMKNYASSSNFKIIDFDNFMKGNSLVTDKLEVD